MISFRIDWLDLLAVQGILESSPAPQFESTNSLALSLLYGLSLIPGHDYWKFHSFEYTNFVSKIMSLLFNTLRCLGLSQLYFQGANVLISWLQSPSAVVLEPKKLKSVTVSIVPPSICHEVMVLGCHYLSFLNVEL